MLNRLVGMWSGNRDNAAAQMAREELAKTDTPAVAATPAKKPSVMRREAILGRDLKVAGYTFMLRRAPGDETDAVLPDV